MDGGGGAALLLVGSFSMALLLTWWLADPGQRKRRGRFLFWFLLALGSPWILAGVIETVGGKVPLLVEYGQVICATVIAFAGFVLPTVYRRVRGHAVVDGEHGS